MKNNQINQSLKHLFFALAFALTLLAAHASAAPGDIDPTFGNGGIASTTIDADANANAYRILIQPDGKIIVGGVIWNGIPMQSFLVRYNPNGTLDRDFGADGKVVSDVNEIFWVSALQPDGKIVAAGYRQTGGSATADFAVARYNANGTLDTSFGAGGKVFTPVGSGKDEGLNVFLQPDGKIVVTGTGASGATGEDFAVVRYNADGSLDATFGTGGKVLTDISGANDYTETSLVQPDGKIVVGGYGGANPAIVDYEIVRYNANGSLDATFGTNGKVVTALSGNQDHLWSLALQPDGKIVAAGGRNYTGGSDFDTAIVRYNPNGSIDTSFGQSGVRNLTWNDDGYYVGNKVLIEPNGKILAVGFGKLPMTDGAASYRRATQTENLSAKTLSGKDSLFDNPGAKLNVPARNSMRPFKSLPEATQAADGADTPIGYAVARFNSDGSLDAAFGDGGKKIARVGFFDFNYGLAAALQADGRILVGGNAAGFPAVMRFHNDATAGIGNLDPTFGTNGAVRTDLPDNNSPRQIEVQPDGKILALAWQRDASGTLLGTYLIRYNQNGSIDTSFGTNGTVRVNCQNECFEDGFVVAPDGKILIAGEARVSNVFRFAVFRLNPDGSRDASWGTNGAVSVASDSSVSYGHEIVLQPDGKVLLFGMKRRGTSQDYDIGAARLNANGSLDTTFGAGGVATVQIPNSTGFIRIPEARLQADGKILFLFESYSAEIYGVGRVNANGGLDTGFATNGFLAVETINWNVRGLALQPDGKFVLATRILNGENIDSTVARYNPNGSPDASFGANGKVLLPAISMDEYFNAVAVVIQPNGKILVGGRKDNHPATNFAVLRLNQNGSIDMTFGTEGYVTVPTLGTFNIIRSMALQPDGKLVAVGEVGLSTQVLNVKLGLVRILLDSARTRFDFDGDGKSDIAVFRPSNGVWYLQQSRDGFKGVAFGQAGDKITPADYDGDGKTDVAVYRAGTWYLQRSSAGFTGVAFGATNDVPVAADYDGDGRAELAVYRPSNGTWYFYNLANNQSGGIAFGASEDKPVPADYDGDGKTDVAVFRPSNGVWYLLRSELGFTGVRFGEGTDKPVPADYDGDGRTDVAVFRPSNGVWYIQRSTLGFTGVAFGFGTDTPTPADYDGDGKADIAVFRNGVWYLQQSANGFAGIAFGAPSDVPVESAYLP